MQLSVARRQGDKIQVFVLKGNSCSIDFCTLPHLLIFAISEVLEAVFFSRRVFPWLAGICRLP